MVPITPSMALRATADKAVPDIVTDWLQSGCAQTSVEVPVS